jgi:organic hydroperoxide reductase OsmC/OhrA
MYMNPPGPVDSSGTHEADMKKHEYALSMLWTGNDGVGTKTYRGYRRDHVMSAPGKPQIPGSSDPAFRGDRTRYNPEELLVAALSACHMLSYLHLCAVNSIIVEEYADDSFGVMEERADGSGAMISVTLHPRVTISDGDAAKAKELHHTAHGLCFIANSVNFPVENQPEIIVRSS